MNTKRWNLLVLGGTVGILMLIVVVTVIIDPFFHYHAPLAGLQYPLNDERYQNDGIIRNYEYQAMITGTSMSQNFKTSEFEELWQVPAVKTACSGASYHELNDGIKRAISRNENLRYVLCSLDGNKLIYPAQEDEYADYPTYLYDDNPFNDVWYLMNKDVVPQTVAVVNYTRAGEETTTMDEYGSWSQYMDFGKEAVLGTFIRMEESDDVVELSEEDRCMIVENVEQNYLTTAKENPEIEFYFFFPPYSIYHWDSLSRTGQLACQMEAEKLAVEVLLTADNVHVYAFDECTDITGNPDNYCDTLHYGEWINSWILEQIYAGEYELTEENYEDYFERVNQLYMNYDYSYAF